MNFGDQFHIKKSCQTYFDIIRYDGQVLTFRFYQTEMHRDCISKTVVMLENDY